MCGVYLVAGFEARAVERAIIARRLGVLNESRGRQSYGLGLLGADGTSRIIKDVGAASDLIDRRGFARAIRGQWGILIGHTRFATHGGVNAQNAHPFEVAHEGRTVVGCHNGVVWNTAALAEKLGVSFGDKELCVDSQLLLLSVARKGGKLGHGASGSLNLLWYEVGQGSRAWMQRAGNPLAVLATKEGVIATSEKAHLLSVLSDLGWTGLDKSVRELSDYDRATVERVGGKWSLSVENHAREARYSVGYGGRTWNDGYGETWRKYGGTTHVDQSSIWQVVDGERVPMSRRAIATAIVRDGVTDMDAERWKGVGVWTDREETAYREAYADYIRQFAEGD